MYNKNVKYNNIQEVTNGNMTTVIGIKCKDGIVIGADSQITNSQSKELGYNKIYSKGNILFAGSGDVEIIERINLDLKNRCIGSVLNQPYSIINCFEEIFHYLNSNYGFKENSFSQILYGFSSGNPEYEKIFFLNRIDTYHLFSNEVLDFFVVGSGGTFAKYILQRIWSKNLTIGAAINTIIYVIREVTKIDIYSSPPLNVAFIDHNGINFIPENIIKLIEDVLSSTDNKTVGFFKKFISNPKLVKITENEIKIAKE